MYIYKPTNVFCYNDASNKWPYNNHKKINEQSAIIRSVIYNFTILIISKKNHYVSSDI